MIAIALALLLAATPAEVETEARAAQLQKQLRCVVCQNESINDSAAPLAADMRALLRERIAAGDSDAEIRDYFAARYGDFVLMNPPLKGATLALWAAPALFVALGGWLYVAFLRRAPAPPPAPLDDAEKAALAALGESERR